MRAGADADIVAVAPIDEVVPAFGARPGMVGDLIGGQAGRGEPRLRRLVEPGGLLVAGKTRSPRRQAPAKAVPGSMVS